MIPQPPLCTNSIKNLDNLIYRAYGITPEEYNEITAFINGFEIADPVAFAVITMTISTYLDEVYAQCCDEDIGVLTPEDRKAHNLNRLKAFLHKIKQQL